MLSRIGLFLGKKKGERETGGGGGVFNHTIKEGN